MDGTNDGRYQLDEYSRICDTESLDERVLDAPGDVRDELNRLDDERRDALAAVAGLFGLAESLSDLGRVCLRSLQRNNGKGGA